MFMGVLGKELSNLKCSIAGAIIDYALLWCYDTNCTYRRVLKGQSELADRNARV